MLHIYADESCKDAHRYMAMGAVAVERATEAEIAAPSRHTAAVTTHAAD